MGDVVYLFPVRSPEAPLNPVCLNYRPLGYQKKSWIYELAPGSCGTCSEYLPDRGQCGKLPFMKECVCVGCGVFYIDRPGGRCSECGERLAAITAPSDW